MTAVTAAVASTVTPAMTAAVTPAMASTVTPAMTAAVTAAVAVGIEPGAAGSGQGPLLGVDVSGRPDTGHA
ncbi:hypothetical protein [Mycobacterium simiae]|uniref:hypothetical protein n=1 Tax=Mycobacterium simiae TaxID=1784 RepID=UPI00165F27F6|nr:hypothetical protein [Mycobacterium simiae]